MVEYERYPLPPNTSPSVVHLSATDQELIAKAMIAYYNMLIDARKMSMPMPNDPDIDDEAIDLEIEAAASMYGAITGEDIPR